MHIFSYEHHIHSTVFSVVPIAGGEGTFVGQLALSVSVYMRITSDNFDR